MKIGRWIIEHRGELKIAFDRWRSYLGAGQLIMIILMAIASSTVTWWHVLGGLAFSIGWEWVDMRYLIGSEYGAGQKKNMELNNKLDKIEGMLKQLGAK